MIFVEILILAGYFFGVAAAADVYCEKPSGETSAGRMLTSAIGLIKAFGWPLDAMARVGRITALMERYGGEASMRFRSIDITHTERAPGKGDDD